MKYLSILAIALLSTVSIIAQDIDPASVIDTLLRAYNDRDIEAFVATYTEDVVCYEYGQSTPFIEGKQRLRLAYGAMFQMSPDLFAESTNRIVQGNKVIDHEVAEGINGGGKVQVVVIYEINDGLISKVTFIY